MIGRSIKVGIAKETSRGVAVPATTWYPHLEFSFFDKIESIMNEQGVGSIATYDGSTVGKIWAEGDLEGKVRADDFGLILLSTFGTVTSSAVVDQAGAFDHTFVVAENNAHPSLSITSAQPVETLIHALAMINSLSITAEMGSYVKFVASLLAKKGEITTATPAYTTQTEFSPRMVSLYIADDLAGLDSATKTDVRSVELTFEKNVEEEMSLGDVTPIDYNNKNMTIEMSMEARYIDTTLQNLHRTATKKAMRLKIENTDVTIGVDTHPSLILDFPKMLVEEYEREQGLNDITTQSLKLQACYDADNAMFARSILRNITATY